MASSSVHTQQLLLWLERYRAGDRIAGDTLFQAVAGRLEALGHRMLKGFPRLRQWTDTADVVQSSIVRLLAALRTPGVDPRNSREFFSLAAEQIRRELLDLAKYCRTQKRGRGVLPQSLTPRGSGAVAPEPAAVEDTEDLERWAAFHEAIEQLAGEEREVVSLIFYHGWRQADVAALFQISERTVCRWWQSACLKLRQTLHEHLPEEAGG